MISNLARRFKNICAEAMKKRPTFQSKNNAMGPFGYGLPGAMASRGGKTI